MKPNKAMLPAALAALFLGGCMTVPSGPSVLVLPGSGKNFDQFRVDDMDCKQYASLQIGGSDANQAASDSVARSAALGTLVGAAAGAAMGGQRGAGVGAGTGLAVGTMAGTGAGNASAYGLQQRYDQAYMQCMYAKGHRVPVSRSFEAMHPAPPPGYAPPPPPQPPPPPR
jgi:hypothetical protein